MHQTSQMPSGPLTDIFISYRRKDTAGHAGRLQQDLEERFPGRVFMDIHNIEAGRDFTEVIADEVGRCGALIVMIGDQWLNITDAQTGKRRLEDPNDLVAIEIAEALKRDTRVIPVLVEGARMPQPADLPAALAGLVRRNAFELSDTRWSYDVEQLGNQLEKICGRSPALVAPVEKERVADDKVAVVRKWGNKKISVFTLVPILIAVAVFLVYRSRNPDPQPQPPPRSSPAPISAPTPTESPASAESRPWQAVVTLPKVEAKSQAEFLFPFVTTGNNWEWFLPESEVKEDEYHWDVTVDDEKNDTEYTITLYLYKFRDSKRRTGKFERLLAAARTGVLVRKGTGQQEWDLNSNVRFLHSVQPDGIRVVVKGPGVKRIFAGQPEKVKFEILTPKDAPSGEQTVEYRVVQPN